ncbi:lasso peptide biosynthesis B2 protein [Paenibacillus bouchesdurhonensis]|uniref:lasso peptide biosynthesis B2 protein n=1 Tax=Paenibacillus bouchesdurhonensis TaxID=1870990 RepID=UPI000DA63147
MKRYFQFIQVAFALIRFQIELRIYGFQKIFPKYVERYPIPKHSENERNHIGQMNHLLRTIDMACALAPFKAECLHRSFLGFRFVRTKCSIPVDLVIGVKKFPFTSHAWLVLNDKNINEAEGYTKQFIIILSSKGLK